MNPDFFQKMEAVLAPERIDAYRQDGAAPVTVLARYLLNMALCESLYSPLQFAEIALRNSLHICLTARFGSEYRGQCAYSCIFTLTCRILLGRKGGDGTEHKS